MDTLEWRTIDKSSWGDGPWMNEPDKKQWRDPTTGLPCLIVRGPVGSLCGYVGVPETHPAYGLSYDGTTQEDFDRRRRRFKVAAKLHAKGADVLDAFQKAHEGLPDKDPVIVDIQSLNVHGGMTYAAACRESADPSTGICHLPGQGEEDNIHWFGFDTAHSGDLSPGMEATLRQMPPLLAGLSDYKKDDVYRDIAYVTAECTSLAAQLHAMMRALPAPKRAPDAAAEEEEIP